jgi:hypothetical protein
VTSRPPPQTKLRTEEKEGTEGRKKGRKEGKRKGWKGRKK